MSRWPPPADGRARRRRVRARVDGTVQGVGFRPFVYRLADELGLGGYVLNDERGVVIEVEGEPEAVEALPRAAARRRRRRWRRSSDRGAEARRAARASASSGSSTSRARRRARRRWSRADTATCADCLAELLDPADRRHRYPFTTAPTAARGSRSSAASPTTGRSTTMAGFEMCDALPRPSTRTRAIAASTPSPTPAPSAGRGSRLADRHGAEPGRPSDRRRDRGRRGCCWAGRIVAIKGIGGYHLACRAADETRGRGAAGPQAPRGQAVRADGAPISTPARELVELTAAEEALLAGRERPIVIARRAPRRAVADARSRPASPDLGVMLPYSPLHHLLLADAGSRW